MRTFRDAKAMAKSLRDALRKRHLSISHRECLEIVATQFGLPDWNTLCAKINTEATPTDRKMAAALRDSIFDAAIPILRIFSADKAREFYIDFLGFALDWEHRFEGDLPLYAQVSRSGLKLHLSEHHGDGSPGATVFVWMRGIDSFHRELIGKRYRFSKPRVEDVPWNARVLEVNDPFGNRLRFSEEKQRAKTQ